MAIEGQAELGDVDRDARNGVNFDERLVFYGRLVHCLEQLFLVSAYVGQSLKLKADERTPRLENCHPA